jgi:Arc/MetJ-type ribon-helix-helix transcriptional regulator
MLGEPTKLTNFRFPQSFLDELDEARSALRKPSLAELVREALRDYLARHRSMIEAVKRARERYGAKS